MKLNDDNGDNARWLAELRTAGAFLTILPVADGPGYRPGGLAAAAWCFPIIGVLVGAVGGLVYGLAAWLGCDSWLAATLAVAALVIMTGGLHEDGLGDFADAMGGANRERRLAIMHDSQAGNFAIVTLILLFAGRIGMLADAGSPAQAGLALLVAAAVSRAAVVGVMHALPPARVAGLSASAGQTSARQALAAIGIAALITMLVLGFTAALICLGSAAVITVIVAVLARRRLGGQTGDVLGAVQLMSEFGCLLVVGQLI